MGGRPQQIPLPDQEYLKECFDYDENTGVLKWRSRPESHFLKCPRDSRHAAISFNNKFVGRKVGTPKGNGYLMVGFSRKSYLLHRVIWKLYHGEEPFIIDHINGIRSDNRISNLISVDAKGNSKNCKLSSNNKSGSNGVYWISKKRKWCASIGLDYGTVNLGSFDNISEARAARKAAEKVLSYSERHGKVLEVPNET